MAAPGKDGGRQAGKYSFLALQVRRMAIGSIRWGFAARAIRPGASSCPTFTDMDSLIESYTMLDVARCVHLPQSTRRHLPPGNCVYY